MSIFYRFRDIASYLSKVADFDPPHLHLAPRQVVIPVEFRGDLWHQKARVLGLSCGVVYVILRLAVLVEHRLVTDRRADGRTVKRRHRSISARPAPQLHGAAARYAAANAGSATFSAYVLVVEH